MIKKALLVITVIAFAVPVIATDVDTETYPPFAVYSFSPDQHKDLAIKVDGKQTVRWPFEYKWLEICRIPVKMKIGMYIRVKDCNDKKVVLVQKDCTDKETVNKGAGDWPCYYGCVTVKILANFKAQIRGQLVERSDVINGNKWSVSTDGSPIDGDGNYHDVTFCVKAWQAKIEKAAAGDEVKVAELSVQARPDV